MDIQNTHSPASPVQARPLPLGLASWFDWSLVFFSLWMIGGLYLDGWAHHRVALESFFTPWHAVLYTGFLGNALLLGGAFARGWLASRSWQTALPAGYGLAFMGTLIFLVGGLADMIWHTLLGIEQSLDALLSPPHLLLAVGGGLFITGPVRAAAQRGSFSPPVLVALSVLLALITFFTSYLHPWIELLQVPAFGGPGWFSMRLSPYGDAPLVIAGVLLHSALLVGFALFAMRFGRLPFGALTLLFALPVGLGLAMHEYFNLIPLVLGIGLLCDGLTALLRPSWQRTWARQLFAFLLPMLVYGMYFGVLKMNGLTWLPALWTGTVLLSGLAGWLVSFAGMPGENP